MSKLDTSHQHCTIDTFHQHGTIYQHNTPCRTLAAATPLISNSTIFDWKLVAGSGSP
jgi:hypothetical protein